MFSANSVRDRKGARSSRGEETIRPSSSWREASFGEKGCSGSSMISSNCGPSPASVSWMVSARSWWLAQRRTSKPKAFPTLAKSGKVSPDSGPQPTTLSGK